MKACAVRQWRMRLWWPQCCCKCGRRQARTACAWLAWVAPSKPARGGTRGMIGPAVDNWQPTKHPADVAASEMRNRALRSNVCKLIFCRNSGKTRLRVCGPGFSFSPRRASAACPHSGRRCDPRATAQSVAHRAALTGRDSMPPRSAPPPGCAGGCPPPSRDGGGAAPCRCHTARFWGRQRGEIGGCPLQAS